MAGTRTTDSFAEGLRKMLGSVTDLKTADDVDMPFAINLETIILQRLKQGASDALGVGQSTGGGAAMGAAASGGPAMPPQGMMPGPPGGAPQGQVGAPVPQQGPPISPAAVPGLMQGPQMPNPDELRRMLSQGNTALRLNNVASRLAGMS